MNSHRTLIIITLIAGLLLAACGGTVATTSASASSALSTNYSDALPVAGQLAAGTLKLDETEVAVDAAQAGELLPLWQALSSLMNSATSSDQEIQGVIAQIESTMTAEQVSAIAAMQITQSDLAAIVQASPAGGQGAASSSEIQATRRASAGDGFGPGGGLGPGAGGGEFIGGGPGGGAAGLPGASSGFPQSTASVDQQATAAAYQNQYASTGVNPMVLRAVIQYLQSKTG